MNRTKTTKALAFSALTLSLLLPAQADFNTDAREVFGANAPSVFGIRGLLKISATMNGQPMGGQEKSLWSNGTVIGDGLLVAAYQSLKPDVSASVGNRPGLKIETELSELKLIDEGGEEFDAKLVLHDEALGLAFIAIDPAGEKAGEFKAKALDVSQDVDVRHLDELIGIGRLPENMRFQAQVRTGQVTAIVERPRKLINVAQMTPSTPVFTQDGSVVGFVVVPKAREGSPAVPVLLPSKYVRDLLVQAKEKQTGLSAEPADEKAEEQAEEQAEEKAEEKADEKTEKDS